MMEKPEKRFRCSLASAPSCQAEESVLHASSFSLSFCLTVLVYQQAGLTAMIRPNAALWTREARVRAVYFHHSMLIPQMGSGFSSVLLVDSYVSRQFPRFRLKNRRTFTLFTTDVAPFVVIDLEVRRNQPQCSNFALNIRTRQSHCGSCRSKGGRCRGTNGNSSYIFSAEKCTFIIKYSKAWKWCRTFSANFFDLNVRHLTCLRSFCVEHSGQLPL